MIDRILQRLREGRYSYFKFSDDWGRKGAHSYSFGSDVKLETYTGDAWFLTVDGESICLSLDDDKRITDAVALGRQAKLERL